MFAPEPDVSLFVAFSVWRSDLCGDGLQAQASSRVPAILPPVDARVSLFFTVRRPGRFHSFGQLGTTIPLLSLPGVFKDTISVRCRGIGSSWLSLSHFPRHEKQCLGREVVGTLGPHLLGHSI